MLCPSASIVIVADSDDRTTILDCLTAGAQGYVLTSANPMQFQRALDTILAGGVFAPVSLAGAPHRAPASAARESPDRAPLLPMLTGRQRDVFQLLAEGCATKAIARRLNLSEGTVKVHLAAIYRALGVRTRIEALIKARDAAPMPPPRVASARLGGEQLN